MWILVAEDEASMGTLLRQGFEEQNHTVTLAQDGEEALAAVATGAFDAIVLDVMMPRVDGFEVARRVRAEKNHTPILMLTARDAAEDIVKGFDAAAEEMRVMADAKELQLQVDAPSACPVQGDEDALRRAVCILIDNAIKFTTGPGEIAISVRKGAAALLSIADTGAGIEPEDLPLIFERFYRASKDRSRKTGGAGLGLSIARLIVRTHLRRNIRQQ